jgi:hypothetical protein
MIGYHHFRPTIPSHTHEAFAYIIRRCWHHDPSMRPSLVQVLLELRILYHHLGLSRGESDWYAIGQTMHEAQSQGVNLETIQLDFGHGLQTVFKYPAGHPYAPQQQTQTNIANASAQVSPTPVSAMQSNLSFLPTSLQSPIVP